MDLAAAREVHIDFNVPDSELHPFAIVDVFTDRPLVGNQLGVFTSASGLSAETMQNLARELNFAETVFVLPPEATGDVRIRIFTPRNELSFAGHPVLGTGLLIASALGQEVVRLETGAGPVPIYRESGQDWTSFGRMDQPIPTWQPYEREQELLAALGVEGSLLPVEAYSNGGPLHAYVALESEAAVAAVTPDFNALGELPDIGANCFAGSKRQWKTRMFAPAHGVAEDAATGSAAGPLAVHLARHGWSDFGEEIEIQQGAEIGRPSVLYARADGRADDVKGVQVAGSAVVVARGEFCAT
jgi:trans-2,3-dihydro-3-hydroxyanthranilate isomerase